MDMLQELEQVKNRLYDRMGCPKFLLYIYIFLTIQDSREAQKHIVSLEHELGNQSLQIESLTEEKIRLLREVAQLKATGNGNVDVSGSTNNTATTGGYYYTSPAPPVTTSGGNTNSQILSGSQLVPKISSNGTISNVGALRLYEFLLGIFFIAAMLNYIFVQYNCVENKFV